MRSFFSKFPFFISSGNHQEPINSNVTTNILENSQEYENLKKNYLQGGMNNDMLSYINKVALKIKFGKEVFLTGLDSNKMFSPQTLLLKIVKEALMTEIEFFNFAIFIERFGINFIKQDVESNLRILAIIVKVTY
jgi:hypothetical protein